MNIYWLEQSLADVPVHDGWLAESERRRLEGLHVPKRRDDWRLGRWTAKCAIATVLGLPQDDSSPANIEILAASSGAPEVYIDRRPVSASISLSHRDGVAACSVAQSTIPLGCDLELIETRSDAFVGDYFTQEEQAFIATLRGSERDWLTTLLWSAKESALKVLRVGLRADTRSVDIYFCGRPSKRDEQYAKEGSEPSALYCPPDEWHPFQATLESDQVLHGWWNTSGSLVRTFASIQGLKPPIYVSRGTLLSTNSLNHS